MTAPLDTKKDYERLIQVFQLRQEGKRPAWESSLDKNKLPLFESQRMSNTRNAQPPSWTPYPMEWDASYLLLSGHYQSPHPIPYHFWQRLRQVTDPVAYLEHTLDVLQDRWEHHLRQPHLEKLNPSLQFFYPDQPSVHAPVMRPYFSQPCLAFGYSPDSTPELRRDWLRSQLYDQLTQIARAALLRGDWVFLATWAPLLPDTPRQNAKAFLNHPICHTANTAKDFPVLDHLRHATDPSFLLVDRLYDLEWPVMKHLVHHWHTLKALPFPRSVFQGEELQPIPTDPLPFFQSPLPHPQLPGPLVVQAGCFMMARWPWTPQHNARHTLEAFLKAHTDTKLHASVLSLLDELTWRYMAVSKKDRLNALLMHGQTFNYDTLIRHQSKVLGSNALKLFSSHFPDDFIKPLSHLHHRQCPQFLWEALLKEICSIHFHWTQLEPFQNLSQPSSTSTPKYSKEQLEQQQLFIDHQRPRLWSWLNHLMIDPPSSFHFLEGLQKRKPKEQQQLFALLTHYPDLESWAPSYRQDLLGFIQGLKKNLNTVPDHVLNVESRLRGNHLQQRLNKAQTEIFAPNPIKKRL